MSLRAKARKAADDTRKGPLSWFAALDQGTQKEILGVIEDFRDGRLRLKTVVSVARFLKRELKLETGTKQISDTIRERVHAQG